MFDELGNTGGSQIQHPIQLAAAERHPLRRTLHLDELTVADLGLDAGDVGWAGGGQEIVEIADAPAREAGEVIEDEGDAHERVVAFLEELKVL